MSRLADLTIVKFVVGASAVAGTYIGLGSLTPSILHFGVQLLIEPLVNIFGSHDEDSIRRTISITLGVIHTLLRLGILVAVVAVYKLYVAVVEKRRLTEFDSRNAFPDIRNGCFLTLLALFAFLTPLFLSGNLVIDGMNAWGYVPQLAVIAATTAVCEEIFFRGLLFRLTENSLGSTIAVLLSSLLFGALHLFNPHATPARAVGIGLEAGLGLSALYMLTRTLWLCIAMHFTWNFVTEMLSLPVSGVTVSGLFRSSLKGNELLTGADFGIEASVLVIGLGIVVGGYLQFVAYRRLCYVAPFWSRR